VIWTSIRVTGREWDHRQPTATMEAEMKLLAGVFGALGLLLAWGVSLPSAPAVVASPAVVATTYVPPTSDKSSWCAMAWEKRRELWASIMSDGDRARYRAWGPDIRWRYWREVGRYMGCQF
jgi:hypothetical protein